MKCFSKRLLARLIISFVKKAAGDLGKSGMIDCWFFGGFEFGA